jgi:FkbM family methyltransferase
MQVRFRHQFKREVKLSLEGKLIRVSEVSADERSVREIFVFNPLRVTRYLMGIQERLDQIAKEYCLDQIVEVKPGVVVDIGSNVGEFTLVSNQKFPESKFIRFEPSIGECLASKRNLVGIDEVLIQKALWNSATTMRFYDKNEFGDSSLIKSDGYSKFTSMQTTTLDIEIDKLGINSIELLKLEAEGAEPEILQGGTKTLRITKWVTADLGPERGVSQQRTFSAAHSILIENGFELFAENPGGRECYLYKRTIDL